MFYWTTIYILRVFFLLFTRFSVYGRHRVPRKEPFILVSNHISHFDPPVFSAACRRAIDWMGSDILFKGGITRFYFQKCNVIKVKQYEADQGALREAMRRIRNGRCVGLFPEGGIRAGDASILGSNYKLYEGAFMIAALAKAPILPCLVIGSERLYNPRSLRQRPPIWVRFGNPIPVQGKGREEIQRLRSETEKAIRQLAEELRATGELVDDDWPKTPQERNPNLPPPSAVRKKDPAEENL
jgi:1-acyl-sn-glycerol-3-phosphate acyltransferase